VFHKHISVAKECSIGRLDGQTVRKNDEEFTDLVDRINTIIKLLQDDVKGRSIVSNRQMMKLCRSFYGYVSFPDPSKLLTRSP
jgi:hypothetical protein